jgi:hypothetical protein
MTKYSKLPIMMTTIGMMAYAPFLASLLPLSLAFVFATFLDFPSELLSTTKTGKYYLTSSAKPT